MAKGDPKAMEVVIDCDVDDAIDVDDVAPATFEPIASADLSDERKLPAYAGPPVVGDANWHYYHPLPGTRAKALLRSTEVFATKAVDDALTPGREISYQTFSYSVGEYVVHTRNPLDTVQWGAVTRIMSILEAEAKGKRSERYIEGRLVRYYNKECHIFDQGVSRAMHDAAVNIGATRMELNVGGAKGPGERIGGPFHVAFYDGTQGSASEVRTTELPNLYQLRGWLTYRPIVGIIVIESGCALSHIIQDSLMKSFREKLGGDVLLISLGGHASISLKAVLHMIASTPGCENKPALIIPDGDPHGAGLATEMQRGSMISLYQNLELAIGRAKIVYLRLEDLDDSALITMEDKDLRKIDALLKRNHLDSDSKSFLKSVKAKGKGYSLGFILASDRHVRLLLDQAVQVFKSCQDNPPKPLAPISESYPPTVPAEYTTTRPSLPPLTVEQLPNGDKRVVTEFCPAGPREAVFSPTRREVIVSQFPSDISQVVLNYDEIDKKAAVELWPFVDVDGLDLLLEKSLSITNSSNDLDIQKWSKEATERIAAWVNVLEPLLVGQTKKRGAAVLLSRHICERVIPRLTGPRSIIYPCPADRCPYQTDTDVGWIQHWNVNHDGTHAELKIYSKDDARRFTRAAYECAVSVRPSSGGASSSTDLDPSLPSNSLPVPPQPGPSAPLVHYCPECPYEVDNTLSWHKHWLKFHRTARPELRIRSKSDAQRFTRARSSGGIFGGASSLGEPRRLSGGRTGSSAGGARSSAGGARSSGGDVGSLGGGTSSLGGGTRSSGGGAGSSGGDAGSSTNLGPTRLLNDQKLERQKTRKRGPLDKRSPFD